MPSSGKPVKAAQVPKWSAATSKCRSTMQTPTVFSGPAVDRLKECRAVEVVVTNSLPIADDKHFDKLTVLSIAPLLGRAIREVFEDGSVTSLFDGHS